VWLASVGPEGQTQAALLIQGDQTWVERIAGQMVFYMQRIPDQLTGPLVEVATVFQRSLLITVLANAWALAATAMIVAGWVRALHQPHRRLAGLVALCTLAILVIWPFTEAGRFLIPLIPCLLIGMVEGLMGMIEGLVWIGVLGRRPRRSRWRLMAAALVLAVSLPYSAYMLASGRVRRLEATHQDFDYQVAYLLIDEERFAHAPPSPLARFVNEHPERVRKVWGREADRARVTLYQVESGP
jgi:hypothetical protein